MAKIPTFKRRKKYLNLGTTLIIVNLYFSIYDELVFIYRNKDYITFIQVFEICPY